MDCDCILYIIDHRAAFFVYECLRITEINKNNRMNNERMTKSKKKLQQKKFMWQGKHHWHRHIFLFDCLLLATNNPKMSSVSSSLSSSNVRNISTCPRRAIIIIILEFLFDWRWNDGARGHYVFYLVWNTHWSGVAYIYGTNRMKNYWIYRCTFFKIFKGTNNQMPLSMNTLNIQWHCLR